MRCYQEMGLLPKARRFLKRNAVNISEYKIYERIDLFYGDGPHLREWKLKNGNIAREYFQLCPWSSGPMAFFSLLIIPKTGKSFFMFRWTNKNVDDVEIGLVPHRKVGIAQGFSLPKL